MSPTDMTRFGSADPQDIAAYLEGLGWSRPEEQPNWTAARLWVPPDASGLEVLAPTRRTFGDYARLVYDLCLELADVRGTDPQRILRDIRAVAYDTIRLRVDVGGDDDSIPLIDGVGIVEHARSMLSAAAASSVEPRRNHPSRRPPAAEDYVSALRMAQTEQGSFIVAIRSPVGVVQRDARTRGDDNAAPQPDEGPQSLLDEPPTMRFEPDASRTLTGRDVVATLMSAVDVAEAAATEYFSTRDLQPFDDAVPKGVSANLCHALASIKTAVDFSVGLSVAWSPRAVPPADVVHLGEERLLVSTTREVLELAAEHLRQDVAPERLRISGLVSTLKRRSGQMIGTATVRAEVFGKMRQVRVMLPIADYPLAIRAHETGRRLGCSGIPRQSGRYVDLQDPTDVSIE